MDDVETTAEAEVVTAKARLRAYEDEVLGADAVRISGEIEKGHGSHYKTKMSAEQRRYHAALEHLVHVEEKLAHAAATLAAAEADHEKAKAHVEASKVHVEAEPDGEHDE